MRYGFCYMMFVLMVLIAFSGFTAASERESVLDRKSHTEKDIILDLPDLPPLCNDMEIWKQRVTLPECGQTGHCALYVEREGTGVPMVLLHGGPGATHHAFHPHFSRAARFAEIIYYDQRGCGISDYTAPATGYSVDQAADDLDALRAALQIDRWMVLGHSYGGTLAMHYVTKYPERTAGLVLVTSATYGLPIELRPGREHRFLSKEEAEKINEVYNRDDLNMAQLVFNAHLNGDWKRQNFYHPSREDLARMALYEWKHDPGFRSATSQSLYSLDYEGVFDDCPLPVLIIEGKWDLTWNTDKARKLHSCFPAAKFVLLERSGHSPFADEPETFFAALHDFVETLSPVTDTDLARWKTRLAEQSIQKQKSLRHNLKTQGWGRASSEKIATIYTPESLSEIHDFDLLLRAGFALYDMQRYEEALAVFERLAQSSEGIELAIARIWQAHLLDLLGKREEAMTVYQSVVDMKINAGIQHSQYNITYSPSQYAQKRMAETFTRIENQDED